MKTFTSARLGARLALIVPVLVLSMLLTTAFAAAAPSSAFAVTKVENCAYPKGAPLATRPTSAC